MLDADLVFLSATEMAKMIKAKEISPVDLMKAQLDHIEKINPQVNAIVAMNGDLMEQAKRAEQAVMSGEEVGSLHGVPVVIKDCIDVAGLPATRGSMIFADHVPSVDAAAVTRLKDNGAIVLGKTNLPEFALWWETNNLVYGRTSNPWNLDRITGGSSGGDAAAVTSGMAAIGLGSDLAGSIRMPSHLCGTVGLKPTHGAVSLRGHWPLHAPRYWHIGPLARTVEDALLAFRALSGADPLDPYCLGTPQEAPMTEKRPLRVGVIPDGDISPVAADVRAAVEQAARTLAEAGCIVEQVSLPILHENDWNELSRILMGIEGSMMVGRWIESREDELHPFMRGRLGVMDIPITEYLDVLNNSEELRRKIAEYFVDYDLLLTPVCAAVAFEHGSIKFPVDDTLVECRHLLRALVPWDITGNPAMSVPFRFSRDGLPIGVQLIGRKFQENVIGQAAFMLQAQSTILGKRPPVVTDAGTKITGASAERIAVPGL